MAQSIHGEPLFQSENGKHNCHFQGKLGELIYICSRCGGCYICKHKFIYFDVEDTWKVKCKDGKFRPCINDGKIFGPALPPAQCCVVD